MKVWIVCFFLIIANSQALLSYTTERPGFSEDSLLTANPFADIDDEYDADILSYSPGLSEKLSSIFESNFIETNIGSISSNQFYREEKIKFHKNIDDSNRILFRRDLVKNYDTRGDSFFLEWEFLKGGSWEFGLGGETHYQKKQNDLAFLVRYLPSDKTRLDFRYMLPDYSRNKRNDEDDRFSSSKEPQVFSIRFVSDRGTYQSVSDFSITSPTVWRFVSEDKQYQYWAGRFSYLMKKEYEGYRYFQNLRFDYRRTITSSLDASSSVDRIKYLASYRIDIEPGETSVLDGYGYYLVYRSYEESGERATGVSHSLFSKKSLRAVDLPSWTARYVLSNYRPYGSDSILVDTSKDRFRNESSVQNKLDLEYQLVKRDDFSWEFTLTFDMDRFGGEETWEGGHSRLLVTF